MTHPHAFIRQYLAIENKRHTLKNQARVVDLCNLELVRVYVAHGGRGRDYHNSLMGATGDYLAALNKKAALFNAIFGH